MSPRAYSMNRRAAAVESTRKRIVQSAIDLYRRQGVLATTTEQVARRADVARATVLNHFGGSRGLTVAAVDAIADSLRVPGPAIFQSCTTAAARLRRLTLALFQLYDRSEPWYASLRSEINSVPALRKRERRFWGDTDVLYAAALGSLRRRRRLVATVVGLTNPATFGALKQAGLSTEEAADVVGELLGRFVEPAL
jgi:AcrR family transcriptional regulator